MTIDDLCLHCPLLAGTLLVALFVPWPFVTTAAAVLSTRGRVRLLLGLPLGLASVYLTLAAALFVSRYGIDWRWQRVDRSFVLVPWSTVVVLAVWLALLTASAWRASRWASRLAA